MGFETLKPAPSDTLPPARPHLLSFPQSVNNWWPSIQRSETNWEHLNTTGDYCCGRLLEAQLWLLPTIHWLCIESSTFWVARLKQITNQWYYGGSSIFLYVSFCIRGSFSTRLRYNCMERHDFNTSSLEAEASRLLWVWAQPGLQSKYVYIFSQEDCSV